MVNSKFGFKPGDKVRLTKAGESAVGKSRFGKRRMVIERIKHSTQTNKCPCCFKHNTYATIIDDMGGVWECLLERSE